MSHNGRRSALRFTALAALSLMLGACGLTAPKSNPGYANLDSLGMLDVDNTLTLSFGPGLLRFAAMHTDDDPETKALLKDLDGVRVRLYEIDGDAQRVASRMNRMSEKLRDSGWEPVAVMRDEGQTVHMLMKGDENQIVGLTVLVADSSEAVVVNVMGDLRPEMFSETMLALDVDVTPEVQVASVSP